MLKLKLAAVAAAAAVVGLATAGGAQAAYEDPSIHVSVSDSTPTEGTEFTTSVTSNADCSWAISFDGTVEEGAGQHASATFTAPAVDERTNYPLVIRCEYDDDVPVIGPADAASNVVTPAAIQTATRTVTITVLPKGDDGVDDTDEEGALPNTGGSNVQLLWIGGALVMGGAAVTIAARRRGARA